MIQAIVFIERIYIYMANYFDYSNFNFVKQLIKIYFTLSTKEQDYKY
jgi:hypothetical protein